MKACSIHLSSIASRWGHPTGRVWLFFPLDRNKVFSLDSWSVFLQDGVTLFVSGFRNFISSEGIPRVGLTGAFFPGCPRDESRHPLVDRFALKLGSVLHSGVFASFEDSVSTPLANKGVGL